MKILENDTVEVLVDWDLSRRGQMSGLRTFAFDQCGLSEIGAHSKEAIETCEIQENAFKRSISITVDGEKRTFAAVPKQITPAISNAAT